MISPLFLRHKKHSLAHTNPVIIGEVFFVQPDRLKKFVLISLSAFLFLLWGWLCFSFLLPALLPVLIGVGVAAFLRPAVLSLSRSAPSGKKLWAVLLPLGFYLLLFVILFMLGSFFWGELALIFSRFPQIYRDSILPITARFFQWLTEFLSGFSPDLSESVRALMEVSRTALSNAASEISAQVFSFCGWLISSLPLFLFTFIAAVFCSVGISFYWENIRTFFHTLLPRQNFSLILSIKEFLGKILLRLCMGLVLFLVLTFGEVSLGLWILHVPDFFRLAALIALLDLLPVLGVGTALIPWGIFSLLSGDYVLGSGLMILFAVITLVRNFLEPKIIGSCMELPPLLSLICIYAGFRLWGFTGAFLVPLGILLGKFLLFRGNKK